MTKKEANKKLKSLHDRIFKKKIHGEPSYAAVVLNPNKPFDYAIEVGLINDLPIFIDWITKNQNAVFADLQIENTLLEKLNNINFAPKENINKLHKSILGEEIETLNRFNLETPHLNNLSKEALKELQYDDELIELIKTEEYISKNSGKAEKLYDCKYCCNKIDIIKRDFIEGGISIGNKAYNKPGTLGCLFAMNDGQIYGISNSHVIKYNDKTEIVHPAYYDNRKTSTNIGELYWEQDWESNKKRNFLDVGIIKMNKNIKIGNFLKSPKIQLKKPVPPAIGMSVFKSGRSTSLTKGVIRSVNTTVYFKNSGQFYYNQIMTTCMAGPGDSGSILVAESGHVVGLLFAETLKKTATFSNHFIKIFNNNIIDKNKINFKQFVNFKFKKK